MPGDLYQMSKTLCKSIRKDGSPCQGHGLKQFDGYCIAHGPVDKVREWRSRGGKNSSTAARLDKRIPERLQGFVNDLAEGFIAVREGTLSPAVYTAMCRGAKEAREFYRLADEEMEAIRAEETQAAAEEIAGAHGDLDILAAAAAIIARQNEYRVQSLVEQDLAEPELKYDETKPAPHLLTAEGKKRFGQRLRSVYKQKDIDDMEEAAEKYTFKRSELPGQIKYMAEMRTQMERTLAEGQLDPAGASAPPPDPALPCDPLTGQPLNELPAGVTSGPPSDIDETEPSPAILEDQIRQIEEQIREYEKNYEIENYDLKRARFNAGLDPEDESLIIVKTKKVAYPELNWSTEIQYWGKEKDRPQE